MRNISFHKDGTLPISNEIFVFGSNMAGRHGKGAAKVARLDYGAVYGAGFGLYGSSYAICTKDENLNVLSLDRIKYEIDNFCMFTLEHTFYRFFVTAVGCGYAGYTAQQIAPMFRQAINCSFPDSWEPFLT